MHLLQAATYILPDYTQFDTTEFVADGYNIFGSTWSPSSSRWPLSISRW